MSAFQNNAPSVVEEVEVPFNPAAEADYDQKPQEDTTSEEPAQDDSLNQIIPSAEPRVWKIGPEDMQRTFIQKPLSLIGKMQWFALVGDALDKALSGPSAMSLDSLFSTPGRNGQIRPDDIRNADTFVQAIAKLMSVAPNFLTDSYLIWLNVPDYDRDIVVDLMKLPPDEGGLSDDDGIGMIETFLDQNYNALAVFFGERLGALQDRVRKLNEVRASRRSRR